MITEKKIKQVKGTLHPRNLHQGQYDFATLIKACPELESHVIQNPRRALSINFSDPQSVLLLNKALLAHFYDIAFWQIPDGYLCPPIPGRVDYLHYIADLLSESFQGNVPKGARIKGLDIGCGANCIYPILGSRSYDWSFVGVDIDTLAVKTASLLIKANPNISKKVTIRHQQNKQQILTGVIKTADRFAFTLCNPPFHSSMDAAGAGTQLKRKNLNKKAVEPISDATSALNFAGKEHELSCAGGEIAFVKQMVTESSKFKSQVCWFTCLLSKGENVAPIKKLLMQYNAHDIKVVEMTQGHKISRFIAWSFLTEEQRTAFFA
ncbi:MAG: 23S rRNA (adenine(1618)-N(6))-methyltransferase RlmF [Psychromonas sp.]